MLLLGVIFVALIVGSIQSISADHLEPGQGIFSSEGITNIMETIGSKYQVYLQVVIRNGDGQLVNVTESTATGAFIPHKITDDAFDTLMGKKEIITIDNIKYEKAQYTYIPTLEYRFIGLYPIFSEIPMEFLKDPDDVAKMYEKDKDHSIWKIHYCATFKGQEHGYECIPIFQVLVPTMTLEPHDVVIHQWSILRELS
jgi:hypothetical protein